jgi:hypothetical protein
MGLEKINHIHPTAYEMKERKQFITDNYIIDVMTKNVFLSLKELNG